MRPSRFPTPRVPRYGPQGAAARLSPSHLPRRMNKTQDDDDLKPLVRPTWSVHELLSTYPAPKISDATLVKLHKASALIPPPEDSPVFVQRKHQLEGLIRLVEAVRLVDIQGGGTGVSDGRVLTQGRPIDSPDISMESCVPQVSEERNILQHATGPVDGYYIVEFPPSRK